MRSILTCRIPTRGGRFWRRETTPALSSGRSLSINRRGWLTECAKSRAGAFGP